MILGLVILIILILVFFYILFAPFYVEINSLENIYRLRFHRLATFSFIFTKSTIELDIKILFWKKQKDLFANGNSKIKPNEINTYKKMESKNKSPITLKKIKGILKSFKINKCNVSIDTGNMQLNGVLFPMVYFINRFFKKNIRINFINENFILIEIENNLARIAYAYIKS